MGSPIDKNGNVYKKGWDGEYRPKEGLFGPEKDKTWTGSPNVERDWLGNPKVERDGLGNPKKSKSGATLYRSRGSGGSSSGGSSIGDDLAGAGASIIVLLGIILFLVAIAFVFLPILLGGYLYFKGWKEQKSWLKWLWVCSCFVVPVVIAIILKEIPDYSFWVYLSLGIYIPLGVIGIIVLCEEEDRLSNKEGLNQETSETKPDWVVMDEIYEQLDQSGFFKDIDDLPDNVPEFPQNHPSIEKADISKNVGVDVISDYPGNKDIIDAVGLKSPPVLQKEQLESFEFEIDNNIWPDRNSEKEKKTRENIQAKLIALGFEENQANDYIDKLINERISDRQKILSEDQNTIFSSIEYVKLYKNEWLDAMVKNGFADIRNNVHDSVVKIAPFVWNLPEPKEPGLNKELITELEPTIDWLVTKTGLTRKQIWPIIGSLYVAVGDFNKTFDEVNDSERIKTLKKIFHCQDDVDRT